MLGGPWPVLSPNCTGYATENAVRIADSFITIPITRSYNHTQSLLTLFRVYTIILLALSCLQLLITRFHCLHYFALSGLTIDSWLSTGSVGAGLVILFVGDRLLTPLLEFLVLKVGLAGPKWDHLELFIYAAYDSVTYETPVHLVHCIAAGLFSE
jgi:hypothetical protein